MRRRARAAVLATLLAWSTGLPAAEPAGHSHALENPLVVMLMADELEWQAGPGADGLAFDGYVWIGRDDARLWLRTEGSRTRGASDEARTELLAWRPIGAWWNLVGGVRHATGAGPARTYALLGLQGTAPYRAGIDADLVAGEGGQFGARVEAEYRLLVTNRLILTPRVEVEAWGRDDAATGIAAGLAGLEAGLRLRYEFRREFAPYLGVEWRAALGGSADLARVAGDDVRERRVVAGVRLWF